MPTGRLTTHALDTRSGKPASGLGFVLFQHLDGFRSAREEVARGVTGPDGRPASPMLEGDRLAAGAYCLEFDAEAYFKLDRSVPVDPFLGIVALNFQVSDPDSHYHVPLILSPFGYSTYRGS